MSMMKSGRSMRSRSIGARFSRASNGAAVDVRVRPPLFCYAEGTLKQAMKIRPRRAGRARRLVRLLDLAENLRFAHNHRVEPRRDAKKMLHGINIFIPIKR